ncbi:MAG: CARDB domain-containing protein [Dehalococcoidales bacterium]|nr:CARDB domain-containing protein [Dehalococcoidales bacterium]
MSKIKTMLCLILAMIMCLTATILAPMVQHVRADTGWTKDLANNPVVSEGVASGAACVIYDSDEGKYKMWYTHATADSGRLNNLVEDIGDLNLGDLVQDIRNLDFQAIAENDADNLKTLIEHLAGLTGDDIKALFIGSSSHISYATSTDGASWQVQSNVLQPNGTEWDKYYIGAPSVIKNSSNDYEMWYTGGSMDFSAAETLLDDLAELSADEIEILISDLVDLDIQKFISDARDLKGDSYLGGLLLHLIDFIEGANIAIGHATSTDSINWVKDGNPVLQGSSGEWDKYGVATPTVLRNSDGSYRMWYTGIETDYDSLLDILDAEDVDDVESALLTSINMAIGYATSTDGVDWNKHGSAPVLQKGSGDAWDKYCIATPSVIKNSDGNYEMWYTGGKTAPDLLLDFLRGVNDLETTIISGTNLAVGHAISGNGINWSKDTGNPILSKGTGDAWDKYGILSPSVLQIGRTYHMWYTGGKSHLGSVLLDILDGVDLEDALGDTMTAIGHAQYTPPEPVVPPSGGDGGPPSGTYYVYNYVTSEGEFTRDVIIISEDKQCQLKIPAGTIGLSKTGQRLFKITLTPLDDPPPPPENGNIIGLAYDFGPDGTTFDPPVIITLHYDSLLLPEGVDEANLVIGYWDESSQQWVELETISIDTEANTITARVYGFTAFAVLAYTHAASFTASDLSITPAEVEVGEEVVISLTLTNTGDLRGTHQIDLEINGAVAATREVTLSGGDSEEVTFATTRDTPGTFTVTVDGLTGSFVVKPVTAPVPAAFVVSDLAITPAKVEIGQEATVKVNVTNIGDVEGTYTVTLKIDDAVLSTREVTLAGHASQEVSFTLSRDAAGTYGISVDGLSGTIVVGMPAQFVVSDLQITPTEADIGEEVNITALVTNTGNFAGKYRVALKINDVVEKTWEVSLEAGASEQVSFTTTKDIDGTYAVTIDGLSGTFVVKLEPTPTNWLLIGGVIVVGLIIILLVWRALRKRRD